MMMNQPDDNLFQDLLSDYAAPTVDDGFTQSVMHDIEARSKRIEKLRRGLIYSACFIGGIIAAIQLPALLNMTAKINIVLPEVPSTGAIPLAKWSWAAPILLGFALWAALDRKAQDIF